ncbi:MAG: dephospho-CoA kinase [Gemmatimonadetes bacterium]|nr:dephospho-CoA kinase [Gemmatimonadota bacterium]
MIEWIGANIAMYGPWLVGGMAMLETALIIGLVLPTEPTLVVATAFALQGHFSFGSVVGAAVLGAVLGDSTGFMIGRWGGPRVLNGRGRVARMARRHQDRALDLFERHAGLSVSLARMVPFVRTLMPLVAGSTGVPYRRFLAFDLLGISGWAFLGLGIAYAGARSWEIGVGSVGLWWATLGGAGLIAAFLVLKGLLLKTPAIGNAVSVGLTGNIAAGKSTVASLWKEVGIPVASADDMARRVVEPGSPGLSAVVEAFGEDILQEDGSLNRKALSSIVFQDEEARHRLEVLVHPRIRVLRDRWMRERMAGYDKICVTEIPLLFEVGLENEFDATVVVDASEKIRLDRLRDERGLSSERARAMMESQMDPGLKRERATHLLVNEGDIEALEDQALEVLAHLRKNGVDRAQPEEGRLRIDMHMHTQASFDCLSDPRKVIAAAFARGVKRIAITDHNRVATALEMAEAFPDSVIPGEEVKTKEGIDVIGLYIQEEIPKGTPAAEVCRRVKDQGGLVYLPHPYARGKGGSGRYAEELAPMVDIIEVFNARLHPGHLNVLGEELADRWSKPRGAGSDAHKLGEVAGAWVEVAHHPNEPAALLAALEHAQVRGVTTPWVVHLASTWAKVRKRLPRAPH